MRLLRRESQLGRRGILRKEDKPCRRDKVGSVGASLELEGQEVSMGKTYALSHFFVAGGKYSDQSSLGRNMFF